MIHDYLSQQSYWARGRSLDTLKRSIENSLCFGIYEASGRQVGFARVVSDYAVFAWIMDLFVLPSHQKQGLSKLLMQAIMSEPLLQNLQRWGLNTNDAHTLYEKFGFKNLSKPEIGMEIVNKPN